MVDDKQDVAIITPTESPEEPEAEPAADDCEHLICLKATSSDGLRRRGHEGTVDATTSRLGDRGRRLRHMAYRKLSYFGQERAWSYISGGRASLVGTLELAIYGFVID